MIIAIGMKLGKIDSIQQNGIMWIRYWLFDMIRTPFFIAYNAEEFFKKGKSGYIKETCFIGINGGQNEVF